MSNRVDFEKLRKRRQRTQTVKRFAFLIAIMAVVLGVIILNNLLIDTGFTVRISDMVDSVGGSGFPVPVPGGVIRDVKDMGGNLVVLNDTNLYIYNPRGKTVTNLQQMSDSTIMVTSSSRVLTYDIGSKRYAIDSRSKNLLAKETEYSMLCGDMNERGDYVIVTSSNQYVSQAVVYNRNFTQIYEWLSSENLVSDVALSGKGDKMAVVCLNTQQGVLQTILLVFDFARDTQQAGVRMDFSGEMALDLHFLEDGRISLLTDSRYRILSDGGTVQGSYEISDGQLVATDRQGSSTLLLTQQRETRSQRLILLDGACAETASIQPEERVRDMVLSDRFVYLLTDSGIQACGRDLQVSKSIDVTGVSGIYLAKNKLYYFTADEIHVLDE